MGIKGILFDKDGTLIDFYEVWGAAAEPVIERLLAFYGQAGNTELKIRILERLGVHGQNIDPEGALAWKPYELIAQDIAAVFAEEKITISYEQLKQQLMEEFYMEACEKRQKYPVFTDLEALMQQLQYKGIAIGLATTDELESTKKCMEKIGISGWISFYGTAGSGYPVKPDGNLIVDAARQWKIEPEEILVVGDTPNDMRFARNGNAIAVGVLSGTGRKRDLEPIADYVIDSIDELLQLLEEIWQK